MRISGRNSRSVTAGLAMIDTIDIIEADVSTIGVGSAMGQAADVKSQAEKILQKGDE